MRDFSWRYFESTGEIDAYLLYKEHQVICGTCETDSEVAAAEQQDRDVRAE